MKSALSVFTSSVGKKLLMALTGLFLCLFLLEHLYGNLLLYKEDGGAAFDEYSHGLVHNLLIRIIEVILFAAILIHIVQGIILNFKNNSARPVKYAVRKDSETSTWASRNMLLTGAFIFFFLVIHLYSFFIPYRVTGLAEGESVAQLVKDAFANGFYSLIYIAAAWFLAVHLNHGFQSAFQTLGLTNKNYSVILKYSGTFFSLLMFIGYASFPVIFYFFY